VIHTGTGGETHCTRSVASMDGLPGLSMRSLHRPGERGEGKRSVEIDRRAILTLGVPQHLVPSFVVPMPSQLAKPFHRDGWVYEERVDGWRIMPTQDTARVRLMSWTGRDHRTLPGVARTVAARPSRELMADSEVAVLRSAGSRG
jgi:ATP-dependent DNA ligase